MPSCAGCLEEFTGLTEGESCAKCRKLAKGLTRIEREQIQCVTTVAHTPHFLQEDTRSVTENIAKRADTWSKTASEHHLGQPNSKQNQNLAKAAALNDRKARLKKTTKGSTFQVELSLMFIDSKGKHQKCQLPPFTDMYAATDPIEATLVDLAEKLETNFLQSPYSGAFPNATYDFSLASCMLNSISGKKSYSIDKAKFSFQGNLESLFTVLVSGGHLSKADHEGRKLCLQIVVPVTYADDNYIEPRASRMTSKKRKHSSINDSTRPSSPLSVPVERSGPRTSYSSRWNRTSHARYAIHYETFSYWKTVCHLSSNSDTHFEILADSHEIEVPKGWVKYIKAGAADGGYISKGLYKYCISARVEGKQVTLFMHKPVGSSNELNKTGLHAELDLLTQGNGFAQSFKLRASAAGVKVPDLKYNAENAFIGTIDPSLAARPLPIDDMAVESNEECSLLFNTFLVVPLLQTKGVFTERKFSGNTQTGDNTDYIGEVVDAFAHHVLKETNRTFMLADIQGVVGPDRSITLFDPQAHSSTGDSGEWDQGNVVIEKFCEEHYCNNVCRKLLLTSLWKEQVENLSARHSLTYIMDQ
ncbi:hypothetical protein F5051DRAFT_446772 [Lentinula edodes]|nr:hypothetical protein F5051DRAFT_446772 [Lentinula edodes]